MRIGRGARVDRKWAPRCSLRSIVPVFGCSVDWRKSLVKKAFPTRRLAEANGSLHFT